MQEKEEYYMTVAEMIKQTRTTSNMTQEEYGQKLGVSRQTVSSWENGRSIPDLQMLIDICNIYHISLDKLLNEDNKFVNKIDFYGRIRNGLKVVFICVIITVILSAAVFIRWEIMATNKNQAFADNAAKLGFTLEDGIYKMKKDGVYYYLPNQKLPFLREDFFAKNSSANFDIDEAELTIAIYDQKNTVTIIFNHNRSLEGVWTKSGEFNTVENTLNKKETALLKQHEAQLKQISKQLLIIHNSVYSY